jgi:hypothetical protein
MDAPQNYLLRVKVSGCREAIVVLLEKDTCIHPLDAGEYPHTTHPYT